MMFGDFAPVLTLPLTIVTERMIVAGTIQTRRRRLTDLLNEADLDHLVVTEASFAEHGSGRVIAAGQVAQIELTAILFAYTTAPTESGTEERTLKQPIPATMLIPPFVVEGFIHLPLEDSLRSAMDEYRGRFVAVTKATYRSFESDAPPVEADLIVLNHSKLHVCIPDGVEWRPPSELAAGGGAPEGGW